MNAKRELSDILLNMMVNYATDFDKTIIQKEIDNIFDEYDIARKDNKKPANLQIYISRFLAAKKVDGLSPKTIQNYMLSLGIFATQINKNVTQINTDDIRIYIVYLTEHRSLKEGSLQTYINTLKSFFSWLTIESVIRKNPMLKIRSQKIDKKHLRHALSSEEMELLRDSCATYREKAMVEFLYSTGCQLSEVIGINTENVNFQERSVKVCGKGGKERTVYFSARAKLMLMEYLKTCPKQEALFLTSRMPYGRINPRSVQYLIQKLGERAKVQQRVHPHLLRHTFATFALNSGMDITIIQALLGHSDITSTQIYASVNQSTVRYEYNRYLP